MYNDDKVKRLHIMLPKRNAYVKSCDGQTKWVYFLIEDGELEKYNTIWDKVSADIKKEFDCEPIYNKIFLKTKINSHGNEVTDFYHDETPRADSNHTCLAVNSLDSAFKRDKNYYRQVFLKECKYVEKNVVRHIKVHMKVLLMILMILMKNKLKI